MNGLISWFARNTVAANLTMVAIILTGLMTIGTLRQEVVPNIIMDSAMVTVVYPGASPEEVEKGVIMRIEKEVQGLAGAPSRGCFRLCCCLVLQRLPTKCCGHACYRRFLAEA